MIFDFIIVMKVLVTYSYRLSIDRREHIIVVVVAVVVIAHSNNALRHHALRKYRIDYFHIELIIINCRRCVPNLVQCVCVTHAQHSHLTRFFEVHELEMPFLCRVLAGNKPNAFLLFLKWLSLLLSISVVWQIDAGRSCVQCARPHIHTHTHAYFRGIHLTRLESH